MDAALNIKIGADIQGIVTNINTVQNSIGGLQAKLKELRASRLDIVDPGKLAEINQEISAVTAKLQQLKNVGKEGFDDLGVKIKLPTPEEVAIPFEIIDTRAAESEVIVAALNAELEALGGHKKITPLTETFNFGQQAGSQSFGTSLANLEKQADKAGKAIQVVDTKVKIFAEGSVNEAKASVALLEAELAALSAQELRSPIGREMAGSLSLARKELVAVTQQAGLAGATTTNAFSKAFGAVRQLAYILPGIGIAGIFNLAFEAIGKLIGGTEELNKSLENIKNNGDVIAEAVGGTAGSIATVQALAAAVRNTTLTYTERENALNRLKEINKSYFGDLTLEAESLKTLAGRVQEYSNALIQEAVVKGFTEEISKQTIEYNKQNDALIKLKTSLDQANLAAKNAPQQLNLTVGNASGAIDQSGQLAIAAKKAEEAFIKQRNIVELLGTAIAGYTGKVQDAVAAQLKLKPLKALDENGGSKTAVIDTLAKTKQALEEIIRLENELGKEDTRPIFERLAQSLDISKAQLLTTKIAEVLRDNVKNGIDKAITSKEVGLLQEQLKRLLNPDLKTVIDTRIEINPELQKDLDSFESKIAPQLADLLDKLPALKTDIKVDPNLVLEQTNFAKKLQSLAAVIAEVVVGLGEAIAEDIGKALAGVKDPFGNLLQLLGDGLISIGKQMIIVGGLAELIQKALGSLFVDPGAAIVVGFLAIAAGAALKSISSQKGVKAFAEGGIVTGPTNALIGEAGPEVVFPLDKLNRFIKGNTGNNRVEVVGQTIISGPNLITVLKRAQTNQGLV